MQWKNTVERYCWDKRRICSHIGRYFRKNTRWAKLKIAKFGKHRAYWHQVGLYYDQYGGLEDGYAEAAKFSGDLIPRGDIFWMNSFGDLLDLEQIYADRLNISDPNGFHELGFTSCSALIKPVGENYDDILTAHVSWYYFNSMLRIIKKYDFKYHWSNNRKNIIPGHTMSFSSYPGVLYSGDDFHTISSGLNTIETSLGNYNSSLWKKVRPSGGLLEGVRVTIANRMARSGSEWTKIFAKHNSGTYNNQWMVLDYKLFKPGKKSLPDNLLWILEQMPGRIHRADLTHVLRSQGYWPSYNRPYYKDIYNMTGANDKVAQFGDYFTYDEAPRAKIFRRDHHKVKDVETMSRMMRYNDYKNDPLSICDKCHPKQNAMFAISSRGDLNPADGVYPFKGIGHGNIAATDMKLTNSAMFWRNELLTIGGPTYDDVPPFSWSNVDFPNVTHYGQPDLWRFEPFVHKWSLT